MYRKYHKITIRGAERHGHPAYVWLTLIKNIVYWWIKFLSTKIYKMFRFIIRGFHFKSPMPVKAEEENGKYFWARITNGRREGEMSNEKFPLRLKKYQSSGIAVVKIVQNLQKKKKLSSGTIIWGYIKE